jgi:hypothetical protein
MEDKKYYVPEIEEFCVGFEFESREMDFELGTLKDWQKVAVNTNSNKNFGKYTLEHIEKLLESESIPTIRVKYLDAQDIIDLGFEYTNNGRDLVKDDIRIRLYIGKEFKIVHVCIYMHDYTVFKGEIKNISEFKKTVKK